MTYRFDGFLQPINDTAHQVGVSTSVFKAGSTVPVKFQLKNAAGTRRPGRRRPGLAHPGQGQRDDAPVDETVYAASPRQRVGLQVRRDRPAVHLQLEDRTTGGNYWRIGVKLDDGQTYYVNIGLR